MEIYKDPCVWGPSLWNFLDCMAMSYPLRPSIGKQKQMIQFFHSLSNILPCIHCREFMSLYLQNHPVSSHVVSQKKLVHYIHQLHNSVNNKLGKPSIPFEEAQMQRYQQCINTQIHFQK